MKPDLPIDTQILWLAAELVEKGFCKHRLVRSDESGKPVAWCALGALDRACELLDSWNGYTEAWRRLTAKVGSNIPDWNNAEKRTAAEVALALRTA